MSVSFQLYFLSKGNSRDGNRIKLRRARENSQLWIFFVRKRRGRTGFCHLEADEKGWVQLNIGPVYRVGQLELGHSYKTSLIQETEGEIYRESGILDPFVVLYITVLSELPGGFAPLTHWGLTDPS